MAFGPASRLGVARFEDTAPVELLPGRSEEEVNSVIAAVYRQVFGNAYLMESERPYTAETQLKSGDISVREFVRQVAKSDAYRSRFFDTCPRYRYTELTTKHLLGRAPDGFQETKYHSGILDTAGFEADIDAYIDSDEYQEKYGEMTVPYYTGYKTQTGTTMVGFTRMFKMLRGASSSDFKGSLVGKGADVYTSTIQGTPLAVIPPSTEDAPGWSFQDSGVAARTRQGVGASDAGKVFRIEVTAYRAKAVNRVSKFRRSNQVFLVPFDRLSDEYKRIHRQGGVISSITPVS